jgi:hypothetical protein
MTRKMQPAQEYLLGGATSTRKAKTQRGGWVKN